MKYLIITLILLLFNAPGALAQEWFEAAESSGPIYSIDSTKLNKIQKVELGEDIDKLLGEMRPNSSFVVKIHTYSPAGPRGFGPGKRN